MGYKRVYKMGCIFLRNRHGFLLFFRYLAIVLLIVLAGVFLVRTINESRLVRREMDARNALSLAEQGISYAMAELLFLLFFFGYIFQT